MKTINEKTKVYGKLLLSGGDEYNLLDLNPQKRTDLARDFHGEPAFAFYVEVHGVAKTIVVVRTGFVIEPFAFPATLDVTFVIDDGEDEQDEIVVSSGESVSHI